jgi:hypothetical protein
MVMTPPPIFRSQQPSFPERLEVRQRQVLSGAHGHDAAADLSVRGEVGDAAIDGDVRPARRKRLAPEDHVPGAARKGAEARAEHAVAARTG